jgi:hypothetical protein
MSFRINHVWAFVSIDDDDEEGVCAAAIGPEGSWLPLIGSDEERIKDLVPVAEQIAATTGMRIKLIKLTEREDIMEVGTPTQ